MGQETHTREDHYLCKVTETWVDKNENKNNILNIALHTFYYKYYIEEHAVLLSAIYLHHLESN